ncbi:unnamed protein product [Schistosoma margrebowiei]|uniref:Uncharacterized protein n=1 Tax=Schistosoma margrebowiei TaxID=48269 RepID=A0A183MY80_9TREM|nr:unnamed protein product [Schistosoma margrebowiei]
MGNAMTSAVLGQTRYMLKDLNYISERVLVILSNNDLDHVNWSHILQLISVMITCIKGGVSTVKYDVFIHKSQLDVLKSNKHDKQLLLGVLLIARQLCSEDNRLTGINYKQWWMETFSNPLLSTHNNNTQNVLSSRCAVVYFCDLLIELLPWETDPKFLQIQVNTRPNWFNPVKRSMNNNRIKIHTDKIRVKPTEVIMSFNEDELIMPIDLECTNMITDNHNYNTYIESCINRWNDYCEIAQGRLAELREHCCATKMVTTDKKIFDFADAYTTPGWSDVLNWLNEIATQRTVDHCSGDISKCRLPSEWNEVNLFR